MGVPAGYIYKDGFYWGVDSDGPYGLTPSGVMVPLMGVGFVATWSGKPAANAVPAGTRIEVTDLNRTQWYSDGTNWRPVNGRAVLYSLPGSTTTPVVSFTASAGYNPIPGQPDILVPAGLALPGFRFNVFAQFNRTIAGSGNTARMGGHFGPLKTTADPAVFNRNIAGSWAATTSTLATGTFTVSAAAKLQPSWLYPVNQPATIGAAFSAELTFNAAVDNYFTFAIESLTVADTGVQLVNYVFAVEG